MSKNKGYGYDRQDAVISKFRRDAKSRSKTSAVAQAIARGKKKKIEEIEEIEEVRFSPKALIELSNG